MSGVLTYTRIVCIIKIVGGAQVKRSELLKILKKNGCKFVEHGANHDIFYSPLTDKRFPVWRHAKDIALGTANAILKQAGVK